MASKYTLIIAEKPDAARRISEAIADKKPKYIKKRGITYYDFTVQGKRHICVPAAGHLFILTPSKENNPKGWNYPVFNLEWVPTYTKKATAWTEKYLRNIQDLSRNASDFIDAADVDTEGEVLLFNILRFICNVKDAKRMKFSTLTREELRESYRKMSPTILHSTLESGLTRHELDALWGLNLTRALTLALKKHVNRGFTLLSTGRVQGPTLAILLKKELQIRKFKPKPFWQLVSKIKVGKIEFDVLYEKEKIWDKNEATVILQSCNDRTATVINIKKQDYTQNPPFPFNTTDLQSEAYRHFKYSPKQTLQIAERLYQRGIISYPRSNSQKLPPIIKYKKILEAISTLKPYTFLVSKLLKKTPLIPNQGKLTDPAHPAIYPTFEVSELKKLNLYQKNIYDLIIRRFLSVFGNPMLRESNKVSFSINGNIFILKGTRTIDPGWTIFSEKYSLFNERTLPDFRVGQALQILELNILSKETKPPLRYNQGTILKIMERKHLGTRSTRANILQTLYDRHYIEGKSVQVTQLGEVVVNVLEEFCSIISSEKLTQNFEEEMDRVYKGEKKRIAVINEARQLLKAVLKNFKNNEKQIGKKLLEGLPKSGQDQQDFGKCSKCGNELKLVRSKRTNLFFIGCAGYPRCTNSYPLPHNAQIKTTGKVCKKCDTPIMRIIRRGQRTYEMCLDLACETKKTWGKL